MSFCLIILAGGNSHRFRSNIGKPYQKIAGKSLVEINVDKARKFKQIKKIVVVYNKKDSKRVKLLKLKNVKLIAGGKNRQQSTFNALKYLINVKKISNTISLLTNDLNIEMSDCFVMGFSQGGMMAFELGQILQNQLAGLAIISSRIISKEHKPNNAFLKTPIFISHGGQDAVLPVCNYNESIKVLKNYNYNYENHLIEKDEHTMSQETITLFQNFIKKNI